MNYLDGLNDRQCEAVMHGEGPLLILAGAGSGKTATMTRRIAALVNDRDVSPHEILAVTFTNKAAGEMRDRVDALIGAGASRDMWILTFHSACLRILRANAEKLGYASGFTVYDPQDQAALIRKLIKEHKACPKEITPRTVLGVISKHKEKKSTPDDFMRLEGHTFLGKIYAELYRRYEEEKRANNAMDFDDLLLNAVTLLGEHQDVLSYYGNRFRYIMVDEYQDTNHLQYLFIRYLAHWHGNICVVGDDDQCIYEWRGADISNILNFKKDFPRAKVIKLEQNYRSKGNILAAANSTISRNRGRMEKKLHTSKDAGAKINYRLAQDERDEAYNVAREMLRLMKHGDADGRVYDYEDFAVLYRTNAQSKIFEEAFLHYNIPYRVIGGIRYYERAEIKDILAYLSLVANYKDDVAFERIINKPSRKIGAVTVDKIRESAKMLGLSMMEAISREEIRMQFPPAVRNALGDFVAAVDGVRERAAEDGSVSELYDLILERSGYLKALLDENTVESNARLAMLEEFKNVIEEEGKEEGRLTDFLARVAMMSDVDNHDNTANAVTCMTVHSAKGLEFPAVFLAGLEEELFPSIRVNTIEEIEGERRLFYVAITRAEEILYMSGAKRRNIYGTFKYRRPSRFLSELKKELLAGDVAQMRAQPEYSGEGSSARVYGVSKGSGEISSGCQGAGETYSRRAGGGSFGSAGDGSILRAGVGKNKDVDVRTFAQSGAGMHAGGASGAGAAKFSEGDEVVHPRFGRGRIVELENQRGLAVVEFEDFGVKKLDVIKAKLKKSGSSR